MIFHAVGVIALVCGRLPGAWADSPSAKDLTELSLEELANIEVTSVSKTPEPRGGAAAAIAVITNDDIRRSGATSIPEALRMAPGVHVASSGGNGSWAVSSRGFASLNSAKLLVLMDGRSLYTPLFSGVFWDVQNPLLEDVDRIEVIRGPGSTLWGANAMNGVINITTKSARDTQGALLTGSAGNEERGAAAFRYGGQLGGDGPFYRVYGTYFDRNGGFNPAGRSNDYEHMGSFGFRSDWDATTRDALTLQGDLYDGTAGQVFPNLTLNAPDGTASVPHGHETDLSGGNVIGRWTRRLGAESDAMLQVYYDRTERRDPSFSDFLDTFDADFQHRAPLPLGQELTWGIAYRLMSDEFTSPFASLVPKRSNDQLVSGFAQDQIAFLDRTLRFTVGTKLEHNDFSGFEVEPSARAAWSPSSRHTFWGAVSRAVRTPTRVERDIFAQANDANDDLSLRVLGNRNLRAEEMIAYELGYRVWATPNVLVDVAAFYNDYDRLVTFEIGDPFAEGERTIIPVRNGNKMHGDAYGGEIAVDWQPAKFWRVAASYSALQLDLRADRDSTDRSSQNSDVSPKNQAQLRSMLDLRRDLELDAWLRWVDNLPFDATSSYWNLDLRLAWHASPSLELALVGQNLLRNHHGEISFGTEVERGGYAKVTWRFGV